MKRIKTVFSFYPTRPIFILFQIFVHTILVQVATGQTLEWVKMFGGDYIDHSHAIALDRSGNSYTTGFFSTTVDFDPGPGVFELTKAGGYFDSYVSKLNPDGDFVWARGFHGDEDVESFDVVVDSDKSVYVVGEFFGTADFDPGPDSLMFYATEPHAGFVVKLDSIGDLLWAVRFGNGWLCSIRSIDLDDEGNVYITGMFGDSLDLDPGTDVYMLSDPGNGMDIFVCKMNTNGQFIWGKHLVGTGNEVEPKVTVSFQGDLYVSGNFTETLEFNLGGTPAALTSQGLGDSFVCKYDSDGQLIWAKRFGGGDKGLCRTLASDAMGNIYLAGYFSGSTDFDPSSGVYTVTAIEDVDIYVVKLNSGGGFLWSRQIAGGSWPNFAHSLAVDAAGKVIVAGHFEGTIDFDSGPEDHSLTSDESVQTFVLGLNEDGQFEWVFGTGGNVYLEGGNKVSVDTSGAILITGHFIGTADFDPGPEAYPLTAPWYEIYVQKILPPIKYAGFSDVNKQTDGLYPNPTSGMLYLKSGTDFSDVSIMKATGCTVSEISFEGKAIDLSHLPNGIYLVRYTTEFNSFVQKVSLCR